MPDTLEQAKVKLWRIGRNLADDEATAQAYAELVLKNAKKRAAGHPSPQSRIAASGLEASKGVIYGDTRRIVRGKGGAARLGGIVWGAEFGSGKYAQFAARRKGGYFLTPAGNDEAVADELSKGHVEKMIDKEI